METPKPKLLFDRDFSRMTDASGRVLCSDRSLRGMGVGSMFFNGANCEKIAVHYKKDREGCHLFEWTDGNCELGVDISSAYEELLKNNKGKTHPSTLCNSQNWTNLPTAEEPGTIQLRCLSAEGLFGTQAGSRVTVAHRMGVCLALWRR